MTIDPKTNTGDIIASVHSAPGTETQVASRFKHCPEYVAHSYLYPLINRLVEEGFLRKSKTGKFYARKKGVDYIKERGYFD